jgi:type VI secretion system protein ImpH
MAADNGPATDPLIADLLARPQGYSFVQAVELLSALAPEAATVGHAASPDQERLRFRADPSLAFPKADITALEPADRPGSNDPHFRMDVTFMGLYGSSSPLPGFYNEAIAQHDEVPNTRRDFLDLFNHRLVSLLYRSWLRYRHYLQYRDQGTDHFSRQLLAFAGLGAPELRDKAGGEPVKLLACVGLLALRPRSGAVVASVVSQLFGGVPVRVDEFVERWVTIDPGQRTGLGVANAGLGTSAVAGARVRDISGKFRLALGPMDFATFRRHLPDGAEYPRVRELVRFLLRDPLAFDVRLRLSDDAVPRLSLGGACQGRLGWSSWLGYVDPGQGAVDFAGDRAAA